MSCSKGTYIRTLASDIGKLLKCGAHLSALRRTASSKFNIDEAVSPELPAKELAGALIPLEAALARVAPTFTAIEVGAGEATRIADRVRLSAFGIRGFFPFLEGAEVVGFTYEDTVLALAEYKGEGSEGPLFNVRFVFSGLGA